MTWTEPDDHRRHEDAACSFCGSRAPADPAELRRAGWQIRYDYPLRFRCPPCRQRQEGGAAAA
ncbi:MAG: hypothetical protein M3406_00735 [Chloroflexota bacterium]|nr:hypothetical protein [Chloroflexota bacterium]